jgi:ubiquitin-like protein Pup
MLECDWKRWRFPPDRDTVVSPMEGAMAEQKRKETRPTKPAEGGGDGAAGSPEITKKGKKIKEDIDKLLDEIDDILEENAEEFVKSYVQRGGE